MPSQTYRGPTGRVIGAPLALEHLCGCGRMKILFDHSAPAPLRRQLAGPRISAGLILLFLP